jgi:hypothetical protein
VEDVKASVVFCDDIRQEVSGKFILLGVYTAEIVCHQAPANLTLSTYIQISGLNLGLHHISAKVTLNTEEKPVHVIGTIDADLDITKPEFASSIVPTGLVVSCDRNSVLSVHLTIDKGREFLAGSIGVTISPYAVQLG